MKQKLKFDKLKGVLPTETIEALETEGFFDASDAVVKRRSVAADISNLEEGERAAVMYISTRSVDRDKEVLDPRGAITDQFAKAPQVLWGHDYSLPPIGKAEWVEADAYGIKAKTTFATTDRAEEVWQLVKGGFLRTTSVGFIPVERVWKGQTGWSDAVRKYNARWKTDLEADGVEIITSKWLLLEYSMVPVPANIDALVTAVAKGLDVSDQLLRELGVDEADEDPEVVEAKAEEVTEDSETEAEPEVEAEVEVQVDGPIVRRYEPQPAEPAAPQPRDLTGTIVVTQIKAAKPIIVTPVKSAPTQEQLIARVAGETLAQLRGRV